VSQAGRALRSMTGFGQGQAPLGDGSVAAELRAVNSRFLDVRVRLPREFSRLEAQLRATASRFFARGQVDISVRMKGAPSGESDVVVDLEAASKYVDGAQQLRKRFALEGELTVSSLLELPGVARQQDPALEEAVVARAMVDAVEQACREAAEMREREGAALEAELRRRLDQVGSAVTEIEGRAEEVKRGVRERLEKRLAALAPELEIEPSRLETLGTAGPVGRKLEFLLQEVGREVNTIGSKAADAPIGRQVVELKTEIEKLREQVLNLE
jgi:uncharacterized protein (TIGR00255 family)